MSAKDLGKACPFEFEGETYLLSPWNYDIQAEYENYLTAKAYARLRAARVELGPEYEDERAALRRDIDSGEYEFGQNLVMKSLKSLRNLKHLMYLCFAYSHQQDRLTSKVTPVLIEQIAKNDEKFTELATLMAEMNSDPNREPPVEEKAGD